MKHKWTWLGITILLAAGSIYAVIQQSNQLSLPLLFRKLSQANPWWLAAAVLCVLFFIYFEGKSITCVVKTLAPDSPNCRSIDGVVYSSADIYFSSITPSASGGQPASLYFMVRRGIPGSIATVALVITLMMYTAAILFVLLICLITRPSLLIQMHGLTITLIVVGALILSGLAGVILLFIRSKSATEKLVDVVVKFLLKLHILRDGEKLKAKISSSLNNYASAAEAARGHSGMLFRCFVYNVLQRSSQIAVSAMMFQASFGGTLSKTYDIWAAQAYVTVGYTCIPIPGAMGAADYMMLDAFRRIIPVHDAAQLELLSRGVSFYSCVIFCGLLIVAAYFINKKNGKEKK